MSQNSPFENVNGYKFALDELRQYLSEQYKSVDTLKSISKQILSSASLIVALIGTLQIFTAKISPECAQLYNGLLIAICILYFLLIAACIKAILPLEVAIPTKADWTTIYTGYASQETELDIYKQAISNYINAIEKNMPIIQRQRRWTVIASVMLPIIVGLLFVLSLLPRN